MFVEDNLVQHKESLSPQEAEESAIFNEKQKEILKERVAEIIREVIDTNAKLIVFLDRSARPIAWMIRAAWDQLAQGKELPNMRFVNIGREKIERLKAEELKGLDDDEFWERITRKFWEQTSHKEYIEKMKKGLAGVFHSTDSASGARESIMIVDDYSETGHSLRLAAEFFTKHFPNEEIHVAQLLWPTDRDDFPYSGDGWWNGTHLPWNSDKSYTLLSEEDAASDLSARAERDPRKRQKGLLLKEEIKKMFSGELRASL
jgi:hypoxanthine phosphoribosyltransferase